MVQIQDYVVIGFFSLASIFLIYAGIMSLVCKEVYLGPMRKLAGRRQYLLNGEPPTIEGKTYLMTGIVYIFLGLIFPVIFFSFLAAPLFGWTDSPVLIPVLVLLVLFIIIISVSRVIKYRKK